MGLLTLKHIIMYQESFNFLECTHSVQYYYYYNLNRLIGILTHVKRRQLNKSFNGPNNPIFFSLFQNNNYRKMTDLKKKHFVLKRWFFYIYLISYLFMFAPRQQLVKLFSKVPPILIQIQIESWYDRGINHSYI